MSMQTVKVDWKKISKSRSMAFILLNTEMGAEREVLSELKKILNVKEAHLVYGFYDIILKVEAESLDNLKKVVSNRIRSLRKVRSTLTLITHRINR